MGAVPGWDEAVAALFGRYSVDGPSAARLVALAERLTDDARAPTAIRGRDEVLAGHIADSLIALELEGVRDARVVADLGSGAGLPGIVFAATLPDAEVSLVESQRDKCSYMASLLAALRLTNARVVCARVEEWVDGALRHDLVVARALAPQPVVLEYAAPLLEIGGRLVEWRGAREAEEEQRALRAAEVLGMRRREVLWVEPFAGARDRHLHVFEKVDETPARFPRRAGVATRKPLGERPNAD